MVAPTVMCTWYILVCAVFGYRQTYMCLNYNGGSAGREKILQSSTQIHLIKRYRASYSVVHCISTGYGLLVVQMLERKKGCAAVLVI